MTSAIANSRMKEGMKDTWSTMSFWRKEDACSAHMHNTGGLDAKVCIWVCNCFQSDARGYSSKNDERWQVLNMLILMQVNANDEYPVHQADKIVRMEVRHLLAWLGCALQHKNAGLLGS